MKCLSCKQPWADLIVGGVKDVENRSWSTRYRGPLLIHAGLTVNVAGIEWLRRWRDIEIDRSALPLGAILGAVDLVDCRKTRASRWHHHGAVGWYFENPRRLQTPIPYKGQLGVFNVPDHLLPNSWRPRY